MSDMTEIRQLDAAGAESLIPQLIGLLQDAVATASLGFWDPLDDADAEAYWRSVIADMAAGDRWLWVALQHGAVIGSVQLAPSSKQNAPHRAEVQKLMVHRTARRLGLGRQLMQVMEQVAHEKRKTLLFLDTNTGSDADSFYRALGYTEVGSVPRYTVNRDGSEHATTIFYKWLGGEPGEMEGSR